MISTDSVFTIGAGRFGGVEEVIETGLILSPQVGLACGQVVELQTPIVFIYSARVFLDPVKGGRGNDRGISSTGRVRCPTRMI